MGDIEITHKEVKIGNITIKNGMLKCPPEYPDWVEIGIAAAIPQTEKEVFMLFVLADGEAEGDMIPRKRLSEVMEAAVIS